MATCMSPTRQPPRHLVCRQLKNGIAFGDKSTYSERRQSRQTGQYPGAYKIAIDYSRAPFPLYVSDINNHRVLVWRDSARFRSGDPADLVIGQPNLTTALPNADSRVSISPSATSLAAPRGIAVDSAGNLYVADSGNNRVLRFPRPVDQSAGSPDQVLDRRMISVSAAVNDSSLRVPAAVARWTRALCLRSETTGCWSLPLQ
jgi:DNA-binding beta-propeller fold protein YncE